MFHAMEVEAERKQERMEREVAIAAVRRMAAPEPGRSFRWSIGRRSIQVGLRIAAEPPLEPVPSS